MGLRRPGRSSPPGLFSGPATEPQSSHPRFRRSAFPAPPALLEGFQTVAQPHAAKKGDGRQENGERRTETGDRRQEAGGRRQEAGGRRQEAGGNPVRLPRLKSLTAPPLFWGIRDSGYVPHILYPVPCRPSPILQSPVSSLQSPVSIPVMRNCVALGGLLLQDPQLNLGHPSRVLALCLSSTASAS